MRQILTCHVTSTSTPAVTWLRSGIVLRDGDLNGTIRIRHNVVSGAFGERVHELLLDTLQLEHSGNYTCEARNKYHARRRNIVVTAFCKLLCIVSHLLFILNFSRIWNFYFKFRFGVIFRSIISIQTAIRYDLIYNIYFRSGTNRSRLEEENDFRRML